MTYDYICKNCDHEFSVEQKITDNPISKCPKCGKLQAKRQISGCNFVLKGDGWASSGYATTDKAKKS